ncbi:MAG: hypothetical protein JW728_00555 [Candidatus Aureabacteria bacterium]|nr:hypothetical protein [Candidatus Auribacterota bacterium]
MSYKPASKCLIVFNSYKKIHFEEDILSLEKALGNRYHKKIKVDAIQLLEPAGIRGNLVGYLTAYSRLLSKTSRKKIASYDCIIFIHDAGLATRMFPLSYEAGFPLKSTIRFPIGKSIKLNLSCIANSLPLIKDSVIIMPIDQYFNYTEVDIKALEKSLRNHSFSMLLAPVPIKRAINSLGVIKLDENKEIARFIEKEGDARKIPKFTDTTTLANTFQLYTTIEDLNRLEKAVDFFRSKKENSKFINELNNSEWAFNKLVCEALTLNPRNLSHCQLAMKKCLEKYNISVGAAVAKGYWDDWSSSIESYAKLFWKLVKESCVAKNDNSNRFIRSKKIQALGKVKNCIFLDCDTVTLSGDYENCLFVNCDYIRLMNYSKAHDSLFYSLKRCNFLRRDMSNYLFARFKSGRRNIEFECEIGADLSSLYWMMRKIADDWLVYHEYIEETNSI